MREKLFSLKTHSVFTLSLLLAANAALGQTPAEGKQAYVACVACHSVDGSA